MPWKHRQLTEIRDDIMTELGAIDAIDEISAFEGSSAKELLGQAAAQTRPGANAIVALTGFSRPGAERSNTRTARDVTAAIYLVLTDRVAARRSNGRADMLSLVEAVTDRFDPSAAARAQRRTIGDAIYTVLGAQTLDSGKSLQTVWRLDLSIRDWKQERS